MYKQFNLTKDMVTLDFDTYAFNYHYSDQWDLFNYLMTIKTLIKLIKRQYVCNNKYFKLSYTPDGCGVLLSAYDPLGENTQYCLQRHTLYKNLIDISSNHFKFIRYEDDNCIIDNTPAWNVFYEFVDTEGFRPRLLTLNINGSFADFSGESGINIEPIKNLFTNVLLQYGTGSFDEACKLYNGVDGVHFNFEGDTIDLMKGGVPLFSFKKSTSMKQYINNLRDIFMIES